MQRKSYEKYCQNCGALINANAHTCPSCGAQQNMYMQPQMSESTSDKWLLTLVLCFWMGTLGIHRFYNNKISTGILMLFTLGGLGLWVLIDLIVIATGNFTDANGNKLKN